MLIRICDHFRNNPKRIDKLIAIKGLPKEWFFNDVAEGVELKRPWLPDIDANIPDRIRHLCEEMYMTFRYPPMEKGQKEFVERRKVIGVKIDYNTEPGREMWDQVERYMEESIPRNERIPVPVVCAKDERSPFETYTPRRTATGSLEFVPSEIPFVNLDKYQAAMAPVVAAAPVIEPVAAQPLVAEKSESPTQPQPVYSCRSCGFISNKIQGLRMHISKKHTIKEKAGVA